jgi:hypothetical protein
MNGVLGLGLAVLGSILLVVLFRLARWGNKIVGAGKALLRVHYADDGLTVHDLIAEQTLLLEFVFRQQSIPIVVGILGTFYMKREAFNRALRVFATGADAVRAFLAPCAYCLLHADIECPPREIRDLFLAGSNEAAKAQLGGVFPRFGKVGGGMVADFLKSYDMICRAGGQWCGTLCYVCCKEPQRKKFRKCGRCRGPHRYCSKDCQKRHWDGGHRGECQTRKKK